MFLPKYSREEAHSFRLINKFGVRCTLTNIRLTNFERMLGKCWINVERSVQTASNSIQHFREKGNVDSMLNESLNIIIIIIIIIKPI